MTISLTIKFIQCAYRKANSKSFPNIEFNKPEKMNEHKDENGNTILNYSSFGCDNCRNYYLNRFV